MQIAHIIHEFLAWSSRHRTPATVAYYAARLKLFSAAFGAGEAGTLTSLAIDAHLHAAGQGQSGTTRRHNAVALTALQNFALRERLIERPWFGKLDKPRGGRRERIATPAELEALLRYASPDFTRVVRGLCQSGARPGELCRLAIDQVHWDQHVCLLAEHKTARKTGKPRQIAIGRAFEATLREAIAGRVAGAVFLSPHKRPWSVDGLETTWRRLRKKAGLAADLVPYHCRHRFGTELLRAGTAIKTVADLMGHSSVTTTELYLHRDVAELASEQDRVPSLPVTGLPTCSHETPSQPDKPPAAESIDTGAGAG